MHTPTVLRNLPGIVTAVQRACLPACATTATPRAMGHARRASLHCSNRARRVVTENTRAGAVMTTQCGPSVLLRKHCNNMLVQRGVRKG